MNTSEMYTFRALLFIILGVILKMSIYTLTFSTQPLIFLILPEGKQKWGSDQDPPKPVPLMSRC
jgi:hypothetical protein